MLANIVTLTVSSASPLAIEVPAVYAAYDVAAGKAVGGSEVAGGYTFRAASGYYRAGAEVGHFYVLGDGSNQKLTLRYEDSAITIPEVPVSADTHITLSGRIYYPGITLIGGEITATVSEGWENENLEIEKNPVMPDLQSGVIEYSEPFQGSEYTKGASDTTTYDYKSSVTKTKA